GRHMDAWEQRTGMTVENAAVRTGVAKHRRVKVAKLAVNCCQSRHRMTLAEDEQILAASGRIGDVDVHEPAVVQRDERNRRRKGATRVKALVDGIAALLEAQSSDV